MKFFGLTLEEATKTVEVWPDCWLTVMVFEAMGTQWRVGMAGATGLDYGVLPTVMRLWRVPVEDRAEVFAGVRVMESAVLEMMRKKQ